jgi:hypothetical protein
MGAMLSGEASASSENTSMEEEEVVVRFMGRISS